MDLVPSRVRGCHAILLVLARVGGDEALLGHVEFAAVAPAGPLLEVGSGVLRRDGNVQALAGRVLLALEVPGALPLDALVQARGLVAIGRQERDVLAF
jgi:hypothetical protein